MRHIKCQHKELCRFSPRKTTTTSGRYLKNTHLRAFETCPKGIQQIKKHLFKKILLNLDKNKESLWCLSYDLFLPTFHTQFSVIEVPLRISMSEKGWGPLPVAPSGRSRMLTFPISRNSMSQRLNYRPACLRG